MAGLECNHAFEETGTMDRKRSSQKVALACMLLAGAAGLGSVVSAYAHGAFDAPQSVQSESTVTLAETGLVLGIYGSAQVPGAIKSLKQPEP